MAVLVTRIQTWQEEMKKIDLRRPPAGGFGRATGHSCDWLNSNVDGLIVPGYKRPPLGLSCPNPMTLISSRHRRVPQRSGHYQAQHSPGHRPDARV